MNQYLPAMCGGMLLGIAAASLLLFSGRVLGVSGILADLAYGRKSADSQWQLFLIAGLICSGIFGLYLKKEEFLSGYHSDPTIVILSGLLVGYGSKLGNGCTSGHGVCGVARLSPRSLVATFIFMITGAITATLMGMS